MIVKNASQNDLQQALQKINEKFSGNVEFKKLQPEGKRIRFTLTVKDSRGKGGALGFPHNGKQKRVKAACWHVHGEFFDALLTLNENAVIHSQYLGKDIYSTSCNGITNNWIDYSRGGTYNFVYASELCECGM